MSGNKTVAIFGSSTIQTGTQAWDDAEMVGSRCATAGLAVITGGYGGTMEAASKGAAEAGGVVIGVTAPALFVDRAGANPYVGEEVQAHSLTHRLGILTERADGVIALPGSIGTVTELLIAWNHNYLSRNHGGTRLPTAAVGDAWRSVAGTLEEKADADPTDIHLAETAEAAVDWLLRQPEIV